MDPESGRDEVADVAIRGGQIIAIGGTIERGTREIDAGGMVVAPGFIDVLASVRPNLHSHTHKITDGVTTCFAMHGNVLDVEGYARRFEASGALVNYGAAVRDRLLRTKSGAADRYKPASPKQIETMKNLADRAIKEGAVGIGFGINYVPGASYEEIFALFETAAKNNVSCHLHARYKGNIFPGTMSLAVQEVIDQQRQRWYVE